MQDKAKYNVNKSNSKKPTRYTKTKFEERHTPLCNVK